MSMLLMYVIPMLMIVPLIRFRPVRLLLGFRDIRRGWRPKLVEEAADVRTIYHFGSKSKPKIFGGMALFETTAGAKYLPPLLVLWIVVLSFQMGEVRNFADGMTVFGIVAGFGYLCVVNFKTRIVLDGSIMHKTDWLFRHQTYDLAELKRAEQDSSESYRLEFADGRSTYILRWISGHDQLKDLFAHALEVNER